MNDSQLPPAQHPAPAPDQTYGAATPPQQPYATAPAAPNPAPKGEKNTIGLIAFIAAIVGFIFACIPGALIVGWILLPIAFILGIVALFLPRKKKGLAITALIVSVVGTIIAVIVFLAVIATSFNDAFGAGDTSVAPPVESSEAQDEAPAEVDQAAETGTRENPAAIGSVITGNDYDVVVNSVALNATDQVLAANQFNETPEAGSSFIVINATVTYTGEDSGFADFVGFDYVTTGGQVITSYDVLAVAPEPALSGELFTGASATGNQVIAIPTGDAGVLRISPGFFADEIFIALQ